MSNTKNTNTRFSTPRFSALWAHLDEPDTKFNPDGVYSVKCVVDPSDSEVATFLEQLDIHGETALSRAREAIESSKLPPPKKKAALEALVLSPIYESEYDTDGIETGNMIFSCKTYATRKNKDGSEKQVTVAMCDHSRRPIDATATQIGNGSIMRINGHVGYSYIAAQSKAYVTLYIGAVQLIDLVERGGSSFDSFADEETNGEADFSVDGMNNGDTFGGDNNGDF